MNYCTGRKCVLPTSRVVRSNEALGGTSCRTFLAFEGFEELDLVGSWDVFTIDAAIKMEPFSIVLILKGKRLLRASTELVATPNHHLGETPQADILLVARGRDVNPVPDDEQLIEWMKGSAKCCTLKTSVCAGVSPVQVAGLVDGRRITNHWERNTQAREISGISKVVEDVRNVRDGNVVTSAGVSAGIDMAHWVVGLIAGAPFARDVKHQIKCYPAPPYPAET